MQNYCEASHRALSQSSEFKRDLSPIQYTIRYENITINNLIEYLSNINIQEGPAYPKYCIFCKSTAVISPS